jgi:uncharacterized protein YjbI with pentapeptide repeats
MTIVMKPRSSDLDLSGAVLPRVNLSRTNLSGANLERINLSGADLSNSNLAGARLKKSILNNANLADANLSEADLSDADFSGANLSHARMISANLDRCRLDHADLRGADLTGARHVTWGGLLNAQLAEDTVIPNELGGDSVFQYLESNFIARRFDWRSECDGNLMTFIRKVNEQIRGIGAEWTIADFLTEFRDSDFGGQEHISRSQFNED